MLPVQPLFLSQWSLYLFLSQWSLYLFLSQWFLYLFPFLCLILALLALPGRFAATFLLFAEEDWLCREGLKALMSAEEAEVFLFIPLFLPPKPNFAFCKVRA